MKKMLRLIALALICAMFAGIVPLAPVAFAAEEEEAPAGFAPRFTSEYAKVGVPLTVAPDGAVGQVTYKWTVGGREVNTRSDTYTPTADDLEKWIEVTVGDEAETKTISMYFSKLPVIYIDTDDGEPVVSKEDYKDATLRIQGNETYNSETTTLYDGKTEIKGRGNATWNNMPKKPYRLKLEEKTNVFGMGKNKNWVLLANYQDQALQRNYLAYNLAGALGEEYMSSTWVDLIFNGEYAGNYLFCEQVRVDDTRVDVFDWEGFAEDSADIIAEAEGMPKATRKELEGVMAEDMAWITSGTVTFEGQTYTIADYPDIEIPNINGGYLLELDSYYDEVSKFRTESDQPINFKNPEFVRTNEDMMNYVKTYIQSFENAVRSENHYAEYNGEMVHYTELMDMDSLVDYWLVSELFFNGDFVARSAYMHKEIDEIMHMGPIWDMDWSSGSAGGVTDTNKWSTFTFGGSSPQGDQWYRYLVKDPYFLMKIQERYWEIRNEQIADMMDNIAVNFELLKESGDANRRVWNYSSSYQSSVQSMENWFALRLHWMDKQMRSRQTVTASFDYSPDSNLELTVKDEAGNELPADNARYAAADGLAWHGNDIQVTIEPNGGIVGQAAVYVNGILYMTADLIGTTTIEISADALSAEVDEKDVIEVQVMEDDDIVAANFITVKQTSTCSHANTRTEGAVSPTCTENGASGKVICNLCAKVVSLNKVLPALGHSYENGQCTNCGHNPIPFEDIQEGDYFLEPVIWAVENDITKGVTDTLFGPNAPCTRAQVVTFLWRAAGQPQPEQEENPFTDVSDDAYYYDAVLWAVEQGITTGMGEDTFCPDEPCTRAQVVTFLWRAAGEPVPSANYSSFDDVRLQHYFCDAVAWAVGEGITEGVGHRRFGPDTTCTRGQIVTFLYRDQVN